MAIDPKTTREHIVSLYGHVKGVKKDRRTKRNNKTKRRI